MNQEHSLRLDVLREVVCYGFLQAKESLNSDPPKKTCLHLVLHDNLPDFTQPATGRYGAIRAIFTPVGQSDDAGIGVTYRRSP